MAAKSERLTILSDAEQEALYGLPDFDDTQRLEYLALTDTELALASSRPGMPAQVVNATEPMAPCRNATGSAASWSSQPPNPTIGLH
ncbi:hypothetical protein XavaCFBP5823_20760 [Xanthomonas axonopodis pv. vasculorum]|nr:hypothetical protein XavaCFBP5823_20760 [Xanthomonas axonopodis pv. vasculorum]